MLFLLSKMGTEREPQSIREHTKHFESLKALFDRRNYDVLKCKTPSVKEAEALFQRISANKKTLDALGNDIDDALKRIQHFP